MNLTFIVKKSYGHYRFYPSSDLAVKICALGDKKAFQDKDFLSVIELRADGFNVKVLDQDGKLVTGQKLKEMVLGKDPQN